MALLEETASHICLHDSEEETESVDQMKSDQEGIAQEGVNQFKQLEMIFGSCQSLLSEMRDVTIQVAANILEADAMKCEPRILEEQIQTLELQLLQEREQNTKKMQAMRLTCQSQIVNMATTVKEYFKKTMEHTSSQHKKELERVHCEGIQEGMRRLRGILQNHMACTHCSSTTPRLFLCSGCWSACYCGEACQRKHWPIHMQTCGGLRSTSNSN